MAESSDPARSADDSHSNVDEIQALAEAVLQASSYAGLGVTVSFDDGRTPRYIYANEAAARILGAEVEAIVGSDLIDTFAPEEREHLHGFIAYWRRGKAGPALVETVVLQASGERVPVEIAFSVVTLSAAPAIVSFVRDITDRKAAEAALRRSEQLFRQLIETAPDAIGVCRGGHLEFVNPALVALCGRSPDALIRRDLSELVHVDDHAAVARHYEEAERGGQPPPVEYRIWHADGRLVYVETSSIPVEYERQPAVLCFTRDTTDRKLLQAHLALRDRMATLGTLAAGVAHEINNPLGYANLNVEAIIRQLESFAPAAVLEELRPVVDAARDGLARVAGIVRNLKDLSTPNSVERWPVDVSEVLDSALNVAMNAVRDKARVERDYAEAPPLRTDPTKLGQIFLNLLLNATEAFPEPLESNVISLRIQSPAATEVVVSVSDNGAGVPRDGLERIFEPFFTTKAQGTGLGLAICQTLAASIEAKLGVESEPGKGTTFTLRLPVRT